MCSFESLDYTNLETQDQKEHFEKVYIFWSFNFVHFNFCSVLISGEKP